MSRLPLSAKFDKPAGLKLKEGKPVGSANYADYELTVPDQHTVGREHEDVIAFPPLVATSRPLGNLLRFQGGGNSNGDPFVFRVAFKADNQGWKLAPARVFPGFGDTAEDAVSLPVGTVAVSIVRMDSGRGAVGYALDLEV